MIRLRLLVGLAITSNYLQVRSRPADSSPFPKPLLQGPLILPPAENETSRLWDITSAFREAVKLGLLREEYSSSSKVAVSESLTSTGDAVTSREPYSLSIRSSVETASKEARKQDVDRAQSERVALLFRPVSNVLTELNRRLPKPDDSGGSYSLSLRPSGAVAPPRARLENKPANTEKRETYSLSLRPTQPSTAEGDKDRSKEEDRNGFETKNESKDSYTLSLQPAPIPSPDEESANATERGDSEIEVPGSSEPPTAEKAKSNCEATLDSHEQAKSTVATTAEKTPTVEEPEDRPHGESDSDPNRSSHTVSEETEQNSDDCEKEQDSTAECPDKNCAPVHPEASGVEHDISRGGAVPEGTSVTTESETESTGEGNVASTEIFENEGSESMSGKARDLAATQRDHGDAPGSDMNATVEGNVASTEIFENQVNESMSGEARDLAATERDHGDAPGSAVNASGTNSRSSNSLIENKESSSDSSIEQSGSTIEANLSSVTTSEGNWPKVGGLEATHEGSLGSKGSANHSSVTAERDSKDSSSLVLNTYSPSSRSSTENRGDEGNITIGKNDEGNSANYETRTGLSSDANLTSVASRQNVSTDRLDGGRERDSSNGESGAMEFSEHEQEKAHMSDLNMTSPTPQSSSEDQVGEGSGSVEEVREECSKIEKEKLDPSAILNSTSPAQLDENTSDNEQESKTEEDSVLSSPNPTEANSGANVDLRDSGIGEEEEPPDICSTRNDSEASEEGLDDGNTNSIVPDVVEDAPRQPDNDTDVQDSSSLQTSLEANYTDLSSEVLMDYSVQLPALGKGEKSSVSVRAYAAHHFSRLRSMFGITESAFQKSMLESGPFVSFQSNSKGAARVGGVFFFSPDGAYLIKTIKKDEVPAFLQMLPKYCSFMEENGRRTLLTRFCGMYDVRVGEELHTFVVMNSVFPARASGRITEKFDLKGSTVGRECSEEERKTKGRDAILKDMDLANEMKVDDAVEAHKGVFVIGSEGKQTLLEQLRRDIALLVNCSVIDYSLLVGVEPQQDDSWSSGAPAFVSKAALSSTDGEKHTNPAFVSKDAVDSVDVDGGELAKMEGHRHGCPSVFYFGLIDFLQPFNVKKTVEWRIKSFLHEKDTFSCVPPEVYARRLLEFLDKHIV